MRHRFLSFTTGLLALCSVLLVQTGCDVTEAQEAVEGLDVILELQPVETFVVGQVLDASTGDLIRQPVEIAFTGEGAGVLVDAYSDPVSSIRTSSGYAAFGVQNAVTPTTASPVRVQVLATVPGYRSNSAALVLNRKGDHSFTLYLHRADAPLAGSESAPVNGAQSGSSGTSADLAVQTPAEANTSASTGLHVPAGAVLRDASGNPLSGAVSGRLSYYSNAAHASLKTFPGGFNGLSIERNGASSQGSLVTAGFSVADVSVDGQIVRSSSTPFTRTLDLSANAINPTTGAVYQPGDEIGIYTYEEATGNWAFQTQATVQAAAGKASGLFVQYTSTGFTTDAAAHEFNECAVGATVNIIRNGNAGALTGYWLGPNGKGMLREVQIGADDDAAVAVNVPEGVSGVFQVLLADGSVAEVDVADLCGGSYDLSLPAPSTTPETVTFAISFPCTLKLTAPVPGFNLVYKPAGTPGSGALVPAPTWSTASEQDRRIAGGTMEIEGLYLNRPYAISFIYTSPDPSVGTVSVTQDLTITGTNLAYTIQSKDMPSGLCAKEL